VHCIYKSLLLSTSSSAMQIGTVHCGVLSMSRTQWLMFGDLYKLHVQMAFSLIGVADLQEEDLVQQTSKSRSNRTHGVRDECPTGSPSQRHCKTVTCTVQELVKH